MLCWQKTEKKRSIRFSNQKIRYEVISVKFLTFLAWVFAPAAVVVAIASHPMDWNLVGANFDNCPSTLI